MLWLFVDLLQFWINQSLSCSQVKLEILLEHQPSFCQDLCSLGSNRFSPSETPHDGTHLSLQTE